MSDQQETNEAADGQSELTAGLERELFEAVCKRYVYTRDMGRDPKNKENYYDMQVQAYWTFWKEARAL